MIDHTGIGVADVGRSATFYDAALGALGMRRVMQMPDNAGTDGVGYGFDYPVFWIDRYHPPPSNSIPPLQPKLEPKLMHSTPPLSRQAVPKTDRPVCVGRITTL